MFNQEKKNIKGNRISIFKYLKGYLWDRWFQNLIGRKI